MPIRNTFWVGGGRDIHVMRGDPPINLSATFLRVTRTDGVQQSAAQYIADNEASPDLTLAFRPLFRGVPTGDVIEGFGIRVNPLTGQINIGAAALRKNNFIVEVVATNVGGSAFRERIRIQIHGGVSRIWLTPSQLTVRPIAGPPPPVGYRFTARAEFDDGTVGDITTGHGVTWASTGNIAADGLIVPDPSHVGTTPTVTATYRTQSAQGGVRVVAGWDSDPNPPTAGIVTGSAWPGTIRPEAVPNILFLGDGFRSPDNTAFRTITDYLVRRLKTDRLLRPFDLLSTSMNYWRAFVGGGRGISVRSEVFTTTIDGVLFAHPMSPATLWPGSGKYELEHLMYAVGLPIPADRTTPPENLLTNWVALLPPDLDPTTHLTDSGGVLHQKGRDLIESWKRQAERGYIDEIDAFPGMSYGSPPAAGEDDYYSLRLHPNRGGAAALRPFYRRLAAGNGIALDGGRDIGLLWADQEPGFHFNNTDLVVLVAAFPGGRAVNATGYIAMSTKRGDVKLPVTAVAGQRRFTLGVPAAVEDSPPELASLGVTPDDLDDRCRTMAHEIAHSFGLGDEYGGAGDFEDQNDGLPRYANLTTEQNAKNPGGDFTADEVKWNWHRIRKAALIEGDDDPADDVLGLAFRETSGQFTIKVRLGHSRQFAVGDRLLLRLRERGTPLPKDPVTLANARELEVISLNPGPVVVPGTNPPRRIPVDEVVVRPVAAAGAVTLAELLATYTPGSLLYLPTPAPDSIRTTARPYADMVALNIATFITTPPPGRKLTAATCNVAARPNVVQNPMIDGVDLPFCFKNKPRIVGLYEGGNVKQCKIFHPTGTCMMRKSSDEYAEFCAVCRYVLVDFVNPFHHFSIDLDYAEIYPQT